MKFVVENNKCVLILRKVDIFERVLGVLIKYFKEVEYRINVFCVKNIKVFKCVILIFVLVWE